MNEQDRPDLEERVRELEANLIAQDHRALPVLRTFFADRRGWDRADPRWRASWTALLWWCIGSLASPAGAAIGLAAFLTLALTGWNAWEFRRQNEALSLQNELVQRQVDQDRELTNATRRAELVATLYDRRDCRPEVLADAELEIWTPDDCPPKASTRARADAALALHKLERSIADQRSDLSEAPLAGSYLGSADLRAVNLMGADLQGANLSFARLKFGFLYRANLSGASLIFADLTHANLEATDISGADLSEAVLDSAYLRDANLSGALLRDATYNEQTRWPDGFDPAAAGAVLVTKDSKE